MAADQYELFREMMRNEQQEQEVPAEVQKIANSNPGYKTVIERTIRTPRKDSGYEISDIVLAGLTPLALSVFTGNKGYGARVAAQNIERMRAEDMKNRWDETKIKQTMEPSGPPKLKPRDYFDLVTKKNVTLLYDEAGGLFKAPGVPVRDRERYAATTTPEVAGLREEGKVGAQVEFGGRGKSFRTDQFGRDVVADKITGVMNPVAPQARTKELQNRINKFQTDIKAAQKDNRKSLREAKNAMRMIDLAIKDGNSLASKTGVMSVIKMIESRISDYDRDYYVNAAGGLRNLYVKAFEKPLQEGERKTLVLQARAILEELADRASTGNEAVAREYADMLYRGYKGTPSEIGIDQAREVLGVKSAPKSTGLSPDKVKKGKANLDRLLNEIKGGRSEYVTR